MNNKKKITIRYFLYILGGAALGACLSLVCFHAKTPFEELFSVLYAGLLASSPWFCILLGLSAVILCYVPLAKAKNALQTGMAGTMIRTIRFTERQRFF